MDGYWDYPSPSGLAYPWYGWIEFFLGSSVWWVHWCFHRALSKEDWCAKKWESWFFNYGVMLGKFFLYSHVTVCTFALIESACWWWFAHHEQICLPTGQSGMIGICVQIEIAWLSDDERQWWLNLIIDALTLVPAVVFQSKPGLKSFICGFGCKSRFLRFLMRKWVNSCLGLILQYTDKSSCDRTWFLYFFSHRLICSDQSQRSKFDQLPILERNSTTIATICRSTSKWCAWTAR